MQATAGKTLAKAAAAVSWLRRALHQDPGDTEVEEALAEAHAHAGETTEAINRYESIVHADPSRIQSWLGLGLIHGRAGHLEASTTCFQKALSINAKEPTAIANLVTVFKQAGEFRRAQELIDSLSEKLRRNPSINKSIADLKIAEGDNITASHHLADLSNKYPSRAENWLNWAASLKALKYTVAPH